VTLIRGTAEQVAERATEPDLERSATDIADAAGELASLGRKTRVVERTLVEGDAGEASTLGRIVEGVVAPFRAGSRNARVSVHVPRDAAVPSAEAVALALHELVENAVVHNDAAEPRAWLHGWTTDDGFLVVQVADDGPGIPDEERAVLAGERVSTQLEHASGLGLWMARWVAGALGGEFAIQSSDGDGTVVELHVPLASS
jgi:signal transduction histidine kinase